MNQQINLYLDEFKVSKDPLNAAMLGKVMAGFIVVLFLVSVFDMYTRWQLSGELEQLRATLAEETTKTDELQNLLARRSQNEELTNRLESAERGLASSRQVHEFLSQAQLGNVTGFSEYFKDLSRASLSGISITEFAIGNGGETVRVAGRVTNSVVVPRFVNKLEQGASPLRNMRFSPTISRSDISNQYFTFVLDTENE